MARAIATITGTALAPGVSRNKRLYTREAIGKMVTRASERIDSGKRPIAMYTSHDSMDVADIGGVVTRIWQETDGSARYTADIPDTPTGRAVAALVDNRDGSQFLRGVSILGNWVGGQKHEQGPDGRLYEAGSDFELARLDLTSSPGVDAAGIDALQAAVGDGEALAHYGIAESAPEALVTSITEETGTETVAESAAEGATEAAPDAPDGVREALAALFGPAAEASLPGTVSMSKRKSGMSSGGRKYADPGYQADHKQRYDITDKSHSIAAWRYINQASKAAKYSASQLKNIKARIRAALAKFGVKTAAEGWVILDAYQVTEAVAEYYGDPSKAGSWCVTACNGPVSLSMSCYSMDPADLGACLSAAAAAAGSALAALDPDMDGDVDVPSGGSGDTDGDSGGKGGGGAFGGTETDPEPEDPAAEDAPEEVPASEDEPADAGEQDAPASETSEAAEGPGETPAAEREPDKETEAPVTTEATTNPGGSAPSTITEADVQKAAQEAAAAAVETYKAERKAAKKAAKKAESAKQGPVKEDAVTESQEDRDKRIIAEALKAAGVQAAVQETQEQTVARLVQEGITGFVQEAISSGAVIPGRAGLQIREHATDPDEAKDAEALAAMSDDEFNAYGGANLDAYMGQNTRHQALHA